MTVKMPTDAESWGRLHRLFAEAVEQPPAYRERFLDRACDGDPTLRRQVEALLAADESAQTTEGALGRTLDEALEDAFLDLEGNKDPEPTEDPLLGHTVGPYRILRRAGAGGMGEVYEATDERLGRRVALKLLPPGWSRDPAAKSRFLREARAGSALDHPNLCTIHDLGETDEQATGEARLFLVLAYYDGETLKDRLARGPLLPREARDVALGIARGLDCAHRAGIVHRDVKPANVMLVDGTVKVLDFGIAKGDGDDALTRTGLVPGTPAYMAPEQLAGEGAGPSADVWALGVVLFEMLTGRRPFGAATDGSVARAVLTDPPPPLDGTGCPPDLARIVKRALEKSPEHRFASAAEMADALERAEIDGTSDGQATESTASGSRFPGGARFAVALAAVALAGILWWTSREPVPPPGAAETGARAGTELQSREVEVPVLRVAPFSNGTEDARLDTYADGSTRLLRDALSASRHLRVPAEGANADDPPADFIVHGEILPGKDGPILAVRVVDAASGEQVAARRVDAAKPAELYGAVPEAARDVRRALGLPTDEAVGIFAADFAARRPEAYEHYLEGLHLLSEYRRDDAARAFEQALDAAPDFTMARFRLGQVVAGQGRTEEARRLLRRAVAESPALDDREARYVRAGAAYVDRRYDEAVEEFRELVDRYPYELDAHHVLALALYGSRRYGEALEVLDTMVRLDPRRAVAWSTRGRVLMALDRPAEALEATERYLELEPGSANAHHLVGDAHRALGDLDPASRAYARALEVDPDFHFATVQGAVVDALRGRELEALRQLTTLSDDAEAEPRHRLDAGFEAVSILRGRGRFQEALDLLRRRRPLLEKEGVRSALGLSIEALCLLEAGRAAEARPLAEQAATDPPGNPYRYWTVRARVEAELGDREAFDTTVAALVRADDPTAERAAAWLSGSRLLEDGRAEEAIPVLRRAVGEPRGPGYAYAAYRGTLAEALLGAGRRREAIAAAERAATVDPTDPRLDLQLDRRRATVTAARARVASGSSEEAAKLLEPILAAWADADPGWPDAAAARQLYDSLP